MIITQKEIVHGGLACGLIYFSHVSSFINIFYCSIDATYSSGLGHLVNDSTSPNAKVNKIMVNSIPHISIFSITMIKKGQHITYDYGDKGSWREVIELFYNWTINPFYVRLYSN